MAEDKCYQDDGQHSAFLRLGEEKEKSFLMLPYGSLLYAQITRDLADDKHELLELTFATHDVKITGYKLEELLRAVQKNTCHAIFKTNSSAAPHSKSPSVLKIIADPPPKR